MIKKYIHSIVSCILLSFFVLIPYRVHAEPQTSLILKPENPSPYSSVTITAGSYSFDVNTAMITWKRGDEILLKGQGERDLTVQTGGVGTQETITVLLETATGIMVEQSITITPESVNILYESPESYTPLFYEGLALPGEQAKVHFTAFPQMSDGAGLIPARSIAYSWYVNDTYLKNASGIGKQKIIMDLDLLTESTDVKVVAKTPNGTIAEKTIKVFPHAVMPLMYTYDEVLGTNFSRLYSKRIEADKDFTLALEPYFLSMNNDLADTSKITWLLAGLPVTPLGGRILAMHPKENSYGSKTLSVSMLNTKRRLQKATLDLTLVFDTR